MTIHTYIIWYIKHILLYLQCAIGRDFSNNLIIDHLFVSRFHAIMVAINGKWRITDKSTRGTLHNNRPLKKYEPTILENGDMINLADSFKFQFFTPAELDEAIYTKNHVNVLSIIFTYMHILI